MTWQAQAYGGRGNYTYSWDGHDNLSGSGRTRTISYHSPGSKSASVTVRSGNQRVTQQCSNSVLIGVPAPQYQNPYPVYTPPVVQAPVKAAPKTIEKVVVEKVVIKDIEDERETTNEEQNSVVMFSLDDIPWGWVAILVILVLFMTVVYLLFNKTKI